MESNGAGSLQARAQARREVLLDRQTTRLEVPGYEGILEVEYRAMFDEAGDAYLASYDGPNSFGSGGGGTTLTGNWNWTTATTAPAARAVGINTTAWATATQVNISETNAAGNDVTNVLAALEPGDRIYVQDSSDATKWGRFQLTAPGTDQGTWTASPTVCSCRPPRWSPATTSS